MSLRLNAFGGLTLERDGVLLSGRVTQRRRLALLVLLARAPRGIASRDRLLALLWPERDEARSRHALSQAVYAIRRDLGESALLSGVDELRLNGEVVGSDVVDFEAALRSGDAERAVELYRGSFLDGFLLADAPGFERWVETERALLEHEYRLALGTLADGATESGDPYLAVRWLRRHAALDPSSSDVALRLMRALVAAGDHAGALRWSRTHAEIRREDLGLEPDPALLALVREVTRPPATTAGEAPAPGGTMPERPASVAAPAAAPSPAGVASAAAPSPAAVTESARPGRPRRSIPALAAAVVALLSAAGAVAVWQSSADPLTPRAMVLADVTGPDSVLSLVVRETLRAELEQSGSVRVLSDAANARTLQLMLRSAAEPVTQPLALEIASRRGVPLVVTASARPVGGGFQVIGRVLDARTERVLATATERPPDEESLLPAVARLAGAIRAGALGLEPAELDPLPAVSTRSLPALRNYAMARQALARSDEQRALELVEAALVHDSLFVLAHHLAGHLLWYVDQQRHSDEHLTRAYELSERLPVRERLIVRARYEQLVRDRPDSALVYWKLLADSHPDEALAYEGMRWVHRALGDVRAMADASAAAFARDPSQRLTSRLDRIEERLVAGDTAAAYRLASEVADVAPGLGEYARYRWALLNGDWAAALDLDVSAPERQIVLLTAWRTDEAAGLLSEIPRTVMQYYPRALLAQAFIDAEAGGRPRARRLLYEVVPWIESADLSPPAYARLAERAADVAARLGEADALRRLRALIDAQDRGRGLRSYTMASAMLDAAEAFVRGEMVAAAEHAAHAREGVFYARSLATIALLEADARAAAGDVEAASALYRELAAPLTLQDGDADTRALVRAVARRRLGSGAAPA